MIGYARTADAGHAHPFSQSFLFRSIGKKQLRMHDVHSVEALMFFRRTPTAN